MAARALSQPSRANWAECSRSLLCQLKPSPRPSLAMPICSNERCSPNRAVVTFMNWKIFTALPRPWARTARPKAAVLLPLPSPALTMSSPRRSPVAFAWCFSVGGDSICMGSAFCGGWSFFSRRRPGEPGGSAGLVRARQRGSFPGAAGRGPSGRIVAPLATLRHFSTSAAVCRAKASGRSAGRHDQPGKAAAPLAPVPQAWQKRAIACNSALASAALPAAVKQADAAVRAKIDLLILQVGRAPTARADALDQARQGQVMAKFLAALQVGQCLGLFLLRQMACNAGRASLLRWGGRGL